MKIKTFAPGKIILFGEHSVVHKRPAIAVAITKGINIELEPREDNQVTIKIPQINLYEKTELVNNMIKYDNTKNLITDYIYEVINLFKLNKGCNLTVNIHMPLGAGLGSSAAITVATIKAISTYMGINLKKEDIAKKAHSIEIKIQGAASPLDTSMSTYGGLIYIDEEFNLNNIELDMQLPLIISDCGKKGHTGKLVESVRQKHEKYPDIVEDIFNAMATIAKKAKKAFQKNNLELIGDYMNINQGLLDAIGVNTKELSDMVYIARKHGAHGSKLTGSGGGGCICAYCPENIDTILEELNKEYNAFKCEHSKQGVQVEIIN